MLTELIEVYVEGLTLRSANRVAYKWLAALLVGSLRYCFVFVSVKEEKGLMDCVRLNKIEQYHRRKEGSKLKVDGYLI